MTIMLSLLISCAKSNKQINGSTPDDRDFNYIKNNITGYYNVRPGVHYSSGEHSDYIAYITIEENALILKKFNIINNEIIYNEKYRFSLDTYDPRGLKFSNGDYDFGVSFDYAHKFYTIYLMINNLYSTKSYVNFDRISNEVDEKLIKYTYDYQKQFTGVFKFDSYTLYGIDDNEFNEIKVLWLWGDDVIINIDNDGFLFIDDGMGNMMFEKYKTKVIDKDKETRLFEHFPSYGPEKRIWLLGDTIRFDYFEHLYDFYEYANKNEANDEMDSDDEEQSFKGYQLSYKKVKE